MERVKLNLMMKDARGLLGVIKRAPHKQRDYQKGKRDPMGSTGHYYVIAGWQCYAIQ